MHKLNLFLISALLLFINTLAAADQDVGSDKYFTANALYNKKLYKLAAEEYTNFLMRYPEHPKVNNAKFGLALSCYNLKDYRRAKQILSELASKADLPYQDQIHNLLGQCYLLENNPSQAEAAFRWSVNSGKEKLYLDLPGVSQNSEESPQVSMGDIQNLEPLERSLAGLIEALFQQKKWNEVITYSDELKKYVPHSKYKSRVNFLSSLAYYQLKQYAKAEATLTQLVKLGDKVPFYEHAMFLLAECQQLQGKLDQSASNHEIITKKIKGKFTPNSLFRIGYINFLQKKYNVAIRDFSDLRSIYPNSEYDSESGIYLGRSYLETGNLIKAQSIFGSLIDDKKVSSDAYLWLGRVFLKRKSYDRAVDVLTAGAKTFKGQPTESKLLFELGNALMLDQKYSEANEVFGRLKSDNINKETERDALKFQAYCLNRAGKYKESIGICQKYLDKFPGGEQTEDVKFLMAENMFFMNDIDKAIQEFRTFIPIQGKEKYTDQARYRLAQCYAEKKEWKYSLAQANELIDENIKGDFYDQLYYIAGIASYEIENWNQAIKYFKEFLSTGVKQSNSDSAMMKLGLSYLKVNSLKDAAGAFGNIIESTPDSKYVPYALCELGKIKFLDKDYKSAEEYLNKIVDYYPNTEFVKQAEYYLGWISLKKKNSKDAEKFFESISKKYPNSKFAANSLLQLAVNQIESGKYSSASENLTKFINVYPNSPEKEDAFYYLYLSKSMDPKNDNIADIFKPFIKKYPKSPYIPSAIYESAWRAKRLGNADLAMKYYQEFIKNYSSDRLYNKVVFELAELYYNKKSYDEAINLLDKLKASRTDKGLREEVLYRLAWCLLGREQDEVAAKTFEELLAEFPDSKFKQTASYQVGEVSLNAKNYEKAYKFFKIASDSKSQDLAITEQSLLRLGESECLIDKWKDAEKTFNKFVGQFSQSEYLGRGYMWLGWSQENLKDYTRAIRNYLKAISLEPNSEIAARSQFQIGECYFALGKYEDAIKQFIKVELKYSYPEWTSKAMLETAQVLEKTGKKSEAEEQLKKIIKKYPGTSEAIMASSLLDKGKY